MWRQTLSPVSPPVGMLALLRSALRAHLAYVRQGWTHAGPPRSSRPGRAVACRPGTGTDQSDEHDEYGVRPRAVAAKKLRDKPVLHSVKIGTIAQLIGVPKPSPLPGTRAPFEFNVTAKVTKIIGEADGDLHLVISDGTPTMIAEAPVFACTTGATSYRRT